MSQSSDLDVVVDVSMDASESNSDTTSNHSNNDRVSPARMSRKLILAHSAVY